MHVVIDELAMVVVAFSTNFELNWGIGRDGGEARRRSELAQCTVDVFDATVGDKKRLAALPHRVWPSTELTASQKNIWSDTESAA